MAAVAVNFGDLLVRGLLQTGAFGAATQAVLSPLSVWLALVLLLSGAGPNSQTQKELWKAVGPNAAYSAASAVSFRAQASALQKSLLRQSGPGTTLVIANAIWTKNLAVRKAYADEMKSLYNAEVQAVSSAAPINAWASKVTKGLIKKAVPDDVEFNMIITNAVYFKGLWAYAFDKAATRKRPFAALSSDGSSQQVQVDMMSRNFRARDLQGSQTIRYADVKGQYRAVRLPYKGSDGLAAVFVLPDKGTYRSVGDAAAAITGAGVLDTSSWVSLYDISTLQVSVPRFKVSVNQLSLTKALQSLGIRSAFDAKTSDFSPISDDPLVVTGVLQSAVVQVDEEGTEAAAVTSVIMTTKAAILDSIPPLVFDRPFLFFLVDDTSKTVLFQGAVTNPSSK